MISETESSDPRYLQGIEYFNECEFFEAHEIWEDVWKDYRGEARDFFKGLIQAAVALHHFGNGNLHGAKKVYITSTSYLKEYLPGSHGLNLETFLDQLQICFAQVLANEEQRPSTAIEIDPELIPEIHLTSTPLGYEDR